MAELGADALALKALASNLWPAGRWRLKTPLLVIFGMTFVSSSLAVIAPLFVRALVDALSHPARGAAPIALAIAYPALRCAGLAIIQARVILTAFVMEGVKARYAVVAYDRILGLGRRFHLGRSTGALARVLERGAAGLETSIRSTHVVLFQVFLEGALACVVISRVIDGAFALILAAVIAGYAVMAITFTGRQVRLRRVRNAQDNAANALVVDGLLNHDLVSAFGARDFEVGRYASARQQQARTTARVQAAVSSMFVGWQSIEALALGGVLLLAAHDVEAGRMSVGALVMVQVYLLQVFGNMGGLGIVYSDARQAFVDLGELESVLALQSEVHDAPCAPALPAPRGHVRFEHVSFGYDAARPVLRGVTLDIPQGRTLAIVGASGAGKTTLAHLLLRWFDPQGGRIVIDGHDLRDVGQESVRDAIGLVPQDTQLFNASIGDNIRYGRPDASDAAVEEAARGAALHRFVSSLPHGYDTQIGERGLKLSGGERQRIAVARLILKDPAVLVFDEATSSLDSLTEAAVLTALRRIARGRTCLVIAHRLATVADADEIAVLDHGRVIERGDHAGLIAAGGAYAALWARQARATNVTALDSAG
jgi:ATP-binding cassette subfamily B protein